MKISEALPNIFKRTYPVLESGTELLLAASLLRFHQIDAIPIGFKKKHKKYLAVLGYSCLSKLLQIDSSNYKAFLEQPCENVAQELSGISSDAEIEKLLKLFNDTRFGFAMVEGDYEAGALVSLRDLLGLFKTGQLSSTLSVENIASPIFSMSSSSSLREVLTEMFTRGFRRIFVDGDHSDNVVTDRRIISYVFSPARVSETSSYRTKNPLDTTLSNVEVMQPVRVSPRLKVKAAANIMMGEIEECLICEDGVITPWDITMKPWKMNKLVLNK